ncbi:conserved exported hypothetical protein [Burkholderia sp. 8Y]|uniref:DUF1254 domain-containing protein n=1 Tax=Burkholderia sp. 8Y TaxID=2653133 RepID=UPI0012F316FC|nr:DUF1254 domain-containing protein [Burkholderia sp. 8Y]VXB77919.1 conserved exported hypothetical protein [Burkholderia sp. 8Y]
METKNIRRKLVAALLTGALSLNAAAAVMNLQVRAIERRGVEAVIWGMSAVNYDLMVQAMSRLPGVGTGSNKIVYWSKPASWKNQTLTPNPDTIYVMPFFDTSKAGPVVLEIPAQGGGTIVGSIDDAWQTALEDVGPAGADKGKGGRYLILPPGYTGKVPSGYIVLRSSTYSGFALLRSNFAGRSAADIAKAVEYGKRVRLYPLKEAAAPAATVFIDANEAVFDSTIPYDERFFESLNRIVQTEPWLTRDKAMIDTLKTIGIEKGRPFKPDEDTLAALRAAAKEAHDWLDMQYDAQFAHPYFQGTHWALPVSPALVKGLGDNFADPDQYPVDARGMTYTIGFFSAKVLGAGQFYLATARDRDGQVLNGARSYRLHVPANAPVDQYWSATVYDRATHALVRDTAWSSRASNDASLQKNADGSVDVYFGPQAPAGKEANWIPTRADVPFEILFRFYGPSKPLYDKTWQLPDLELAS